VKTWLQQRFNDLLFWITVVTSVASITYGYSTIRSSQVRVEEKTAALEVRLDKISTRLDNLIDLHVHERAQGASLK